MRPLRKSDRSGDVGRGRPERSRDQPRRALAVMPGEGGSVGGGGEADAEEGDGLAVEQAPQRDGQPSPSVWSPRARVAELRECPDRRPAGRRPPGCPRAIRAWSRHSRGHGGAPHFGAHVRLPDLEVQRLEALATLVGGMAGVAAPRMAAAVRTRASRTFGRGIVTDGCSISVRRGGDRGRTPPRVLPETRGRPARWQRRAGLVQRRVWPSDHRFPVGEPTPRPAGAGPPPARRSGRCGRAARRRCRAPRSGRGRRRG